MEEITFAGKSGMLITVTRHAENDYSAWWRDGSEQSNETAGFSVRGTLIDIIKELKDEV